jgi:hypothetical protein
MSDLTNLQLYLRNTNRYHADIDGRWGPQTNGAILLGFEDGPDTQLTEQDYLESAERLRCPVAHIKAVATVEAAGAGFQDGKPKILPERHRFSKITRGRFDGSHPHLSYPKWGTRPYPKTQEERYALLLQMIRLDIQAGFAACSYGKFQILGENHEACGYPNPQSFAFAQAFDEETQLKCFEKFIETNGLLVFLREGIWTKFAARYNGPAYRQNRYDVKLAQAVRHYELRASQNRTA